MVESKHELGPWNRDSATEDMINRIFSKVTSMLFNINLNNLQFIKIEWYRFLDILRMIQAYQFLPYEETTYSCCAICQLDYSDRAQVVAQHKPHWFPIQLDFSIGYSDALYKDWSYGMTHSFGGCVDWGPEN